MVKNPPANAGDEGDMGLIPVSGRSSGEGNGNPLQYSCLENPMDRGAWWVTVHGGHKRIGYDLVCMHTCMSRRPTEYIMMVCPFTGILRG